jgi:hypothetical protein
MGCVRVLTNFYSVPAAVGREVQVKVYAADVEIWSEGKCIATHERCFSRQKKVLNLEHYLDALTKKPGALAGAAPLEQWRAQGRWPESFDRLWDELKQRRGKREGTKAMIDLLIAGRRCGYDALRQAVEKTLEMGCSDENAVLLMLNSDVARDRRCHEAVDIGHLSRYDRPQPTTTDYDQLLQTRPATEAVQ